jgi:hypothetical protein
MSTVELWH